MSEADSTSEQTATVILQCTPGSGGARIHTVRNGSGRVTLGSVATCVTDADRVGLALSHGFAARSERCHARLVSMHFDDGRHTGVDPVWMVVFDMSEYSATLTITAARFTSLG